MYSKYNTISIKFTNIAERYLKAKHLRLCKTIPLTCPIFTVIMG